MSLPKNAYNCSILRFGGKLLITCRAHDRNDWRTNLYIAELAADLTPKSVHPITMPVELENNSHEDARLFQFQDSLWISWTVSQYPAAEFRSIVVIGKLIQDDTGWKIGRNFAPQHGKNDFTAIEKSWLGTEVFGTGVLKDISNLYVLYLTHEEKQTWLKLDDQGGIVEVLFSKALPWKWGNIHGGALCRHEDKLFHFFHSRTMNSGPVIFRYHIGCAVLAGEPPFDMLQISQRPIIYGHEGYSLDDYKRWKPNVCFPGGAIFEDGKFHLAYGENDSACVITKLGMEDLNL